jgi:hypothetical protein
MRCQGLLVGMLLVAATWATTGAAQDGTRERSTNAAPTPAAIALPIYKPPALGAPARTIGGGTRGTRTAVIFLSVLAPDHVGLTTREQPTLYWYLSEPTTRRIEFSLTDDRHPEPLVAATLPQSAESKIRRIRLADYKVRLEPGVRYEWSVALVTDPERRARDTITTGAIERSPAPASLVAELRDSSNDATFVYAEAGIWYDALDVVSEAIAARPSDALLAQRAALLEQVGLREIADRTRAGYQ